MRGFGGRRLRPALAVVAGFALTGWAAGSCPGRTPAPAAASASCAPVEGPLAAGARADSLAGEFRLTLVAGRGARSGQSTSGRLTLRRYGSRPAPVAAAAGVRYPLFGGAEVDLAAIGALALGDVRRADAARPGVLGMEWARAGASAETRDITLRLGADANQGGAQRFDGTYMALAVTSVSPGGFYGTWESGAGQPQAGGYFCAERARG